MYPRYYLVEVVLLLVLSHGGWNGPSVSLLSCTSDSSKVVREVLNKRFWPLVSRHGCSVSEECPLHPRRDVFGWLRTELLLREEEGALRCPLCGRTFPRHDDFASHLDAQHATVDAVCLDAYCDVFRCDVLQQQKEEVDVKAVAKRECDKVAMAQVQAKCRSLMRQCTIGMLANLSSQDFQEIEEDLDQYICSFLTCERYWDDYDSQVRPVPVLILAFFGLVVVTAFCFCYYGTWLLLERQPSTQICCKCQKAERRRPERRRTRPTRFLTPDYVVGGDVARLTDDVTRVVPEYSTGRVIALPYPSRQNSPEYSSSRQNSPDYSSRRRNNSPSGYLSKQNSKECPNNSLEYPKPLEYPNSSSPEYPTKRQTSSDYPPSKRHNSPDYINREEGHPNRQSSLEYPNRQNSHEYRDSRQNSPEYPRRRHNSPEYLEPQSEYPNRHSSMERTNKQNSSEYPNRHSSMDHPSRQNSPEYPSSRQKYPDKRPNSEHTSKQNSNRHHDTIEYPSRQNSPEYTYPIRRRPHSLDYPSRQNSPEFPNPPPRKFLSKQHSLDIQDPPSYTNNHEYSRKRQEFSPREESPEYSSR